MNSIHIFFVGLGIMCSSLHAADDSAHNALRDLNTSIANYKQSKEALYRICDNKEQDVMYVQNFIQISEKIMQDMNSIFDRIENNNVALDQPLEQFFKTHPHQPFSKDQSIKFIDEEFGQIYTMLEAKTKEIDSKRSEFHQLCIDFIDTTNALSKKSDTAAKKSILNSARKIEQYIKMNKKFLVLDPDQKKQLDTAFAVSNTIKINIYVHTLILRYKDTVDAAAHTNDTNEQKKLLVVAQRAIQDIKRLIDQNKKISLHSTDFTLLNKSIKDMNVLIKNIKSIQS